MSDFDATDPAIPRGGVCPTCGATVPPAARFCPNCGTPRDQADGGDVEATRVMAPVDTGRAVYDEEVVEPAPVVRERPWPWALTLGVPALILLLLLIVLAVQSMDSGDDGPDETTTSIPATSLTTTATSRPVTTRPAATTAPPETTAPPATEPPTTAPPATDPPATVSIP